MVKFATVPLLLVIACFFAGTYGAVHNQISYTVAPEYFTAFKFHQFGIADGTPDRVGAAIVGWHAAWWMGIVIGIILIPMGLSIPGNASYFWGMIRVFGVVATTTLVVGLAALGLAFLALDAENVGEISRYHHEISDDLAFARAGTMHNFSYLGGFAGILTGAVAVSWHKRRRTVGLAVSDSSADATEPGVESAAE